MKIQGVSALITSSDVIRKQSFQLLLQNPYLTFPGADDAARTGNSKAALV